MKWYFEAMNKYAVFEGRSRRKEYWMFVLMNIIIGVMLGVVEAIVAPQSNGKVLARIYQLAVMVPTIAVGVRRLHDTEHSGWWLLFPVVNLILLVRKSQPGTNRFGADPTATSPTGEILATPLS